MKYIEEESSTRIRNQCREMASADRHGTLTPEAFSSWQRHLGELFDNAYICAIKIDPMETRITEERLQVYVQMVNGLKVTPSLSYDTPLNPLRVTLGPFDRQAIWVSHCRDDQLGFTLHGKMVHGPAYVTTDDTCLTRYGSVVVAGTVPPGLHSYIEDHIRWVSSETHDDGKNIGRFVSFIGDE